MNMRGDVDVHADIKILKLSINSPAEAGLEGTCRDGHAIANFQRGFLVVQNPDFRILNELGVAVAHQERKRCSRYAHLKIVGNQVAERIQRKTPAATTGPASRAGAPCARYQRDTRGRRYICSQGAEAATTYLHHRDINYYLRFRLVVLGKQIFR